MVLLLLSGWVNGSFRQAARNVNAQSCSSVLWYLGLAPIFPFDTLGVVPPYQIGLLARETTATSAVQGS